MGFMSLFGILLAVGQPWLDYAEADRVRRQAEIAADWVARSAAEVPGADSLEQAESQWASVGSPADLRWVPIRNGLDIDLGSVARSESSGVVTVWTKMDLDIGIALRQTRLYCDSRELSLGVLQAMKATGRSIELANEHFLTRSPVIPESVGERMFNFVCGTP